MKEINEKELKQVSGGKREEEDKPFCWPFRDKGPFLKNTYAREWFKELTDEEKNHYRNLKTREEREAFLFMHDFEL